MAEPVIDAEKQGKLDRFVFNALSGDNPGFESAKNWMKKGGRINAIVTDDSKYSANIFHHAVKNGWYNIYFYLFIYFINDYFLHFLIYYLFYKIKLN